MLQIATNKVVNLARLENGDIVEYDAASVEKEPEYYSKNFVLIGKGIHYKRNGVLQSGTQKLFFYRKRDK